MVRLCESRRYYLGIENTKRPRAYNRLRYASGSVMYGMDSYHLGYLLLLPCRYLRGSKPICAAVGRARLEHPPSRRIYLSSEVLGFALNVSFVLRWLVLTE